jgi:tRNA threonylcarbamoyladenosine biosynthesis protein TsaB
VLDARRGEAFVAAYLPTERGDLEELVSPRALAPEQLGSVIAQAEAHSPDERRGGWLAVGDGAVRFRGELEAAAATVPADDAPVHLLSAAAICRLGAEASPAALEREVLPEYGRRPDAEISLERKRATGVAQAAAAAHAPEGGAA